MIKHRAGVLLAVAALAVGVAGCGSSSSSSSAAKPLTKTAYEQQLGPLLNNQVAPALRTALSNGGIANPQKLGQAIADVKLAHDRMAAVTPPTAIAGLHGQAVTALGAIQADMQKLRTAELNKVRSDALAALAALKTDAAKIVTIGNEFSARGF